MPRSLRQRVRLVCVEQGRPVQEFVAEAIREYLAAPARRSRPPRVTSASSEAISVSQHLTRNDLARREVAEPPVTRVE
jgi:hypothetical protein